MSRIEVPMLVADPAVCSARGIGCFENVRMSGDVFLDGPMTQRVAVLDFDEQSGELHPGVRYLEPRRGPTKKLIEKRATLFDTMTASKPGEGVDVMV